MSEEISKTTQQDGTSAAAAAAPAGEKTMTGQQREELTGQSLEKEAKLKKQLRRSEKGVKEYQYFIIRLAVLLLLIWALFFQVVGLTHMPSGDMYPRLDLGDLVLFYRLDKDVRAQDVIAIEKTTPDTKETKLFICRVVAAQGDTVEITDEGRLKVNGNVMIETNIFYATPRYEGYTEFPLTLGPGECFVLADKRDGGADSRYFGPVSRDEILGTVITIVRRNKL